MTRAAIYCRVSTEEQKKGWSLAGQLEDDVQYCRRMGYRIVRIVREVHSGSDPARPGFLRTIRAAEDGEYDVLVVWRRNRAGRDPVHLGLATRRLNACGVRLEAVDLGYREESPHAEFVDNIIDAVSRYEVREIAARMHMGRLSAARGGKWPTRPPYGYRRARNGHDMEPDPETAPLVQWAFEMSSQGHSLNEIAERLDWHPRTTCARLHNAAYKGTATYDGIKVHFPALVTVTTWETVQRALRRRQGLPGTVWRATASHQQLEAYRSRR